MKPALELTQRQSVLDEYEIWGTKPEAAFDEIAELAARVMNCPYGFFSLISDDERWVKAGYGVKQMCMPRERTLCNVAAVRGEAYIVPDALSDPDVCDHPAVKGNLSLRAYVGVPVRAFGGMVIGTLCVYDTRSHTWGPDDVKSLKLLASQLEAHLELRRRVRTLERHETVSNGLSRKEIAHIAQEQIDLNARVLHDFRNVLAAIRANVDFLQDAANEAETEGVVTDVREACQRGLNIVRDLEDFADTNRDFADQLVSDTEVEVVALPH
jgi:GAF domain-containing protein